MLTLARSVRSLIVGSGLVTVGNGLLGTAISLRMSLEGFSAVITGLVLSAFYVGFISGATSIARLVRRVGHIRVFAAMAAAASATSLLIPLVPHPLAWLPLRAVMGFVMAGLFMVIESWLNASATSANRGGLLALYISVAQLALASGQMLVPVFVPMSMEPFVVAAALYALASIPIALTYIEQPSIPELAHYGVARLFHAAPLGVMGCLIAGIVTSALVTLGPLYMVGRGRSIDEAAVFMTVAMAGGLLLQWPLGRFSDRAGRRPVLVGVNALLSGVAFMVALFEPGSLLMLLVIGAAAGALCFVIYPLALSYANDVIAVDDMVAGSGTLLLSYGVGAVLGPTIGTMWMGLLGARGVFYWIGTTTSVLALMALYRWVRRPRIPADERTAYVPLALPHTAPIGQLDPRTDTGE